MSFENMLMRPLRAHVYEAAAEESWGHHTAKNI